MALLLAASVAATAAADPASEAQLQFELGAEMYRQRRLPEALERFVASHRLVPNPNVAFNVAQVYGLMGRPTEAYNWYEEHLSFPLPDADRAAAVAAQAALGPQVAVIDVGSDPAGAELFIDRTDLGAVGRTPRRVAVAAGERVVFARLAGHRDGEARVAALRGRTVRVSLVLARREGALRVRSDPPGATVRLEGRADALGTTPLGVALPIGLARISISAPGRVEQSRSVEIREGETAAVEVRLAHEAATVATLTVRAHPEGARVLVGGREVGRAPLTRAGLSPGPVRVEVRAPRHEPWSGSIVLEAGAATRVTASLVRDDARTWRGWYWIALGGGGLLLAGGAAVGALAWEEHDAFDRTPTRAGYDRLRALNLAADLLAAGGLVAIATTLAWDLASGPAPASKAQVRLDR